MNIGQRDNAMQLKDIYSDLIEDAIEAQRVQQLPGGSRNGRRRPRSEPLSADEVSNLVRAGGSAAAGAATP